MPVINLTYPAGSFNVEQKRQLASDLSTTLVKWEGNADNPRALGTVWMYFDEVQPESYAVAGQLQSSQKRYLLNISVPEGILSEDARNGLVAEATRLLLEAEAAPVDLLNSLRVYCLIHEIADGNWGTANKGLRLEEMRALYNPTR